MTDLIERLRNEATWHHGSPAKDDTAALLDEAAAALEAAREDACVSLVADIRFACGDNGKRMQPELVEFIRGLAQDAERYRQAREAASAFLAVSFPPEFDGCPEEVSRAYRYWHGRMVSLFGAQEFDAAIDQARGNGVGDEA